jgi:tetratricopeptide (TPR) repeat protein
MMLSRPRPLRHTAVLTGMLTGMLMVLLFASSSWAQALPPGYQRNLSLAQAAMREAVDANVRPFPDQPLWAKAIRLAEAVVEMAPREAGGLGLLAEAYSRTNFFGRAWPAWEAYLDAGHDLTPEQTPIFLGVGEQLAWSAYEGGDRERAAELHLAMLDAVPFSKESRVWVARIRMEQGRPVDAIPYWEAVVAQDPEDDRARYFLNLARDQARWGVAAADAFRQGVAHYEAGDMDAARRALERATDSNPQYAEAWAWRGRIAFEAASYLVALRHYERAVELAPDVDAYRYFRNESQRLLDE